MSRVLTIPMPRPGICRGSTPVRTTPLEAAHAEKSSGTDILAHSSSRSLTNGVPLRKLIVKPYAWWFVVCWRAGFRRGFGGGNGLRLVLGSRDPARRFGSGGPGVRKRRCLTRAFFLKVEVF